MAKRIITLVGVVLLGIIIGVSVVRKQVQSPILRAMLEQQEDILMVQKRMESKLFPQEGTVFLDKEGMPVSSSSAPVNDVQIKALEVRVANLEDQIASLTKKLKPILRQLDRPKPPPEDYSKVYDLKIDESPFFGKKDAPVTIVEFSDMQCPYCARCHKVINDVLKAFPNDVKLVFKHFPLSFHSHSHSAAKAVLAAGEQGKFFEMITFLLNDNRHLGDELYKKAAKELGLDVKKFIKAMEEKDEEWEKILQRDIRLGIQSDVRGTPTFFINGRKTRARSLVQFKREIEAILKKKNL